MFHLDYSDNVDDILIYQNKIYIVEKNDITSNHIEQMLSKIKYETNSKIIDTRVEYSKIPSLNKIFYTLIFNLKIIPSIEEFVDIYINSCFVENKDYTYSPKNLSIKFPQKYSYIALKNRIHNEYPLLIKYYHLYLMFYESKKFDKVINSLKHEIYKGLNLNIKHNNNSYRIIISNNGYINLDIKTKKKEYINLYTIDINSTLETKINNFVLFNKEIISIIEEKIISNEQIHT